VILTQVPASTVRTELLKSQNEIEQELGNRCDLFAYPNGNWNADVREAVAESGYRLAFTTKIGEWTHQTDPLLIPRINISENHIVGPGGHFSSAVFDYSVFWRRNALHI
jgi:peptidoglycan/xylan/chitin deacetylase (PgdA/CDA1 family)